MGFFDFDLRSAQNPHLLQRNVEGKEKIYLKVKKNSWFGCRAGNYYVVVEDETIGKKLYALLSRLKGIKLVFKDYECTLTKYKASFGKVVKWFCFQYMYSGSDEGNIFFKYKNDRTIILNNFVEAMFEKGFCFEIANGEDIKCNTFSEWLTFFKHKSEYEGEDASDENRRTKTVSSYVRYLHYRESGISDFEEFYKKLDSETMFFKYSELPYSLPIVKTLYEYYKDNTLNIFATVRATFEMIRASSWRKAKHDESCLVDFNGSYATVLKATTEREFCTIYSDGIKILKDVPKEYIEFLLVNFKALRTHDIYFNEQIEALIIDRNENLIGYKFKVAEFYSSTEMLELELSTQKEWIDYTESLVNFVEFIKNSNLKFFDNVCGSKNHFIEGSIVFSGKAKTTKLRFSSVEDAFLFGSLDTKAVEKQVVKIAFEALLKLISSKYALERDKNWLETRDEIKYLSPTLCKAFINYALNPEETASLEYTCLCECLKYKKLSARGDFYYDSGFEFDPSSVKITFRSELKSRYDVDLTYKRKVALPDGRKFFKFNNAISITNFKSKEKTLRKLVAPDKRVRLVEFSELVIDSEDFDQYGMYNLIGYITEPFEGEHISSKEINQLTNKELLRMLAYLGSCPNRLRFIWNNIYRTNEDIFYITYLEIPNVTSSDCTSNEKPSALMRSHLTKIEKEGYNPFAFIGLSIRDSFSARELSRYLLELSDSFDSYCKEHNVYYNSEMKACPVCLETRIVISKDFASKFEMTISDNIAEHYRIDNGLCIKLYSEQLTASVLEALKENVLRIVHARLFGNPVDLQQKCFIPYKAAFDNDGRFVGYVYKAVKFDSGNLESQDVCINIADVNAMSNLPRLKSLIRFLLQIRKCVYCYPYRAIVNPFTYVFLNKAYKKQVQILNIDCISQSSSISSNDSLEILASQYVCGVISKDAYLDECAKDVLGSSNVESLLNHLIAFSKKLTMYCQTHKQYYNEEHIFCPKCIPGERMEKVVRYACKADFVPEEAINEGGEAFIYDAGENNVIKVFKEQRGVNLEYKTNILLRIFSREKELRAFDYECSKYRFIVPQTLLVDRDSKQIFGYEMEKVSDAFALSTLRDTAAVEKLGFTRGDIIEILITMGKGIEALHSRANMYIGDLNGRNVLFDRGKNVYFIDFDGMGIDEIAPTFCTDGYIDPVSKKKNGITKEDDWYSFAVHTFYYLTYTHPFNGIYREKLNGGNVRMLEIPEKMERRISLLGNHKMQPPEIAVDWSWMSKELTNMLCSIFEGDCRESIVPLLEQQCGLSKKVLESSATEEFYCINENFVANKQKYFATYNVIQHISPEIAVCEIANNTYIVFISENRRIRWSFNNPISITLSKNKNIVFIVEKGSRENRIVVMNLQNYQYLYEETISKNTEIVIDDQAYYFLGFYGERQVIFKRKFLEYGRVETDTINIGKKGFRWFSVEEETKFVLIRPISRDKDEVYSNSEKFLEIKSAIASIIPKEYRILYDKVSKMWLVINNCGNAILIKKSGECEDLSMELGELISDVNISNVEFINGNVYIPLLDELAIFNVKKSLLKKMECRKIINPKSKIFNINSEGYIVLTDNTYYLVRKTR